MPTIPVNAGDDLQAAINSAVAGDVLELEAGATFTGNFTLPVHAGTSYITIQSAGTLPAGGVRVSPAAAAAFAKIQASAGGQGAITTDEGAAYWQIIGIAFPGNPGGFGEIITLGNGDHTVQTSTTQLPHHLILDRCYIYGDSTDGQKRGVGVNCGTVTIQNCYISDCKLAGQDAQAIAGWNGPGPFLIDNNYLEGSAENVLFGGGTAASVDLMPANLTFTNNTVNKPTSWRSTTLQCKNLLELKMMATAVIDSNTFTNNWANAYSAGQSGFAVLFTVRNEEGLAPFANITDVQFTRNTITGAGGGISVLGTDDRGSSYPSGTLDNLLIRDNLFTDIAESWGGSARFLQINHGGTNIVVDHNTCLNTQSAGSVTIYLVDGTVPALVLQNNILVDNGLCVFGTNGMTAGSATLADQAPGYTFTHNVLIGGTSSGYPAGNFDPATTADVGFTDLAGGDYRLTTSSPYHAAATDGDDIGDRLVTAPVPGDPPTAPASPFPATLATGVSTDGVTLSWTATGADQYDVAFGTSATPATVSPDQVAATYATGALAASTTYYWQITAKNANGSAASAVWQFTTAAAAVSGGGSTAAVEWTTNPLQCLPPAADAVAITPSGVAWTSSAWTTIGTLGARAGVATALVVRCADLTANSWFEIDLGVGAAASETVIGTMKGLFNTIGNGDEDFGMVLPFALPLDALPASTRVAARVRLSTTDTTPVSVAVTYYTAPIVGTVTTTTAIPAVAPSNAVGITLTTPAVQWAYSGYGELIASTATPIVISGIVTNPPGFLCLDDYEVQIATGSAGNETPIWTFRGGVSDGYGAPWFVALKTPLSGIAAGTRISARTRMHLPHPELAQTGQCLVAIQYYPEPV